MKNDTPMLFMKFGRLNRLEDIQKGKIYMKRYHHFRYPECEIDIESGKYDVLDPAIQINGWTVDAYDKNTNMKILTAKAELQIDPMIDNHPLFCMFHTTRDNIVSTRIKEGQAEFRLQFTKKQQTLLQKEFGEHVLLIVDPAKFFTKLHNGFAKYDGTRMGSVEYYDPKTLKLDMLSAIRDIDPFWKKEKYSYQQEFRIYVPTAVEDHLIVDVGNLKDCTEIYKSKEILSSYMIFKSRN